MGKHKQITAVRCQNNSRRAEEEELSAHIGLSEQQKDSSESGLDNLKKLLHEL